MKADLAVLDEYDLDWLLEPQENPFASMKFDAHLQDKARWVQTNRYIFAVAARR